MNDFPLKNVNFEMIEESRAHLDTESSEKVIRIILWDDKNIHLKNCVFPKEETYLYEILSP
jgi:hypothetical protein